MPSSKKLRASLGLSLLLVLAAGCKPPASGPWTHGVVFDRIVTIVLENTNYSDAAADPYLKSVADRGALLTNFHGRFHPSYANYLGMVGGDYFGTILDFQKNIDAATIADLLELRGLSWKNYAQDYPGDCFLGSTSGSYARKHVPFLSFKPIQKSPERCARVVNADQFAADFAAGEVPNYAFYSPNLENDGHDSDLPTASKWLQGFLEPLLADPAFMERTVIEITFDESKTYLGNHVYTALIGPAVKAGFRDDAKYDHYDMLRTVEENFGVGTLGRDDDEARAIQSVWVDEGAAQKLRLN